MSIHDAEAVLDPEPAPEDLSGEGERLVVLEAALAMEEIDPAEFGDGVRSACEMAGFVFLFDLPTIEDREVERIAAAADPDAPSGPLFAFVALHADHAGMSVDTQCHALEHGEAVASAYLDLLSH